MILEITAPSLWCRRSVTNIVLRFLMVRKVLKATTASSRLRLGALSLGRDLENFSAYSRTTVRIRNQKESYFGGQGKFQDFRPVDQALLVHLCVHSEGILCGFYFSQCHPSEPLTQFLQKRIDYSKMYHLLGARVEVISPPFPDNV